ncbi:hypothetical protein MPER_01879, partial [Moniliophthora perniciosa FA553]
RRVRPGFETKVPRTPDEFARRWKSSQERSNLLTEIDVFNHKFPIGGQTYRLKGDMSIFIGGVIGQFVTAIIMSSLFFNLPADTSSFYTKSALLFWAVLMNAVGGQLEEDYKIADKRGRI